MKINPYQHQTEGLEFFKKNKGRCAFFWEVGTGKTLAALLCYEFLKKQIPDVKMFVFCPLTLVYNAWMIDIKKFSNYTFFNIHDEKDKTLDADIYLCNYDKLCKDPKRIHSDKKFQKVLAVLDNSVTLLTLDESQKLKNYRSNVTKNMLTLPAQYKLILTGTPAPNSEQEYWGQVEFLHPKMLGKNFHVFKNKYFHLSRGKQQSEVPNGQIMNRYALSKLFKQGWKYDITDKNRVQLMNMLKPFCNFKKSEDCIDLPDSVDIIREIEMGAKQRAAYLSMKKDLVLQLGREMIAAPMALTKIMKLRQITSGFILSDDKAIDLPNAKKDELVEVLDELGTSQAVIWVNFKHESLVISALLGDKCAVVDGSVSTSQKNDNIDAFKAGEVQYLIANMQSVSHGITLTNCNYQIFYSLSYSNELHIQAKGRIMRIGQKKKCFYIYLLCKDSIDTAIMDVLNRKLEANQLLEEFLNVR